MTQAITKIDYQGVTKLPLRQVVSATSSASMILVKTPHKGEVAIDTQEVGGMFSRKVTEKTASEIGYQIQKLEKEAKEYLLDRWIISEGNGEQ